MLCGSGSALPAGGSHDLLLCREEKKTSPAFCAYTCPSGSARDGQHPILGQHPMLAGLQAVGVSVSSARVTGLLSEKQPGPALALLHQSLVLSVVLRIPLPHSGEVASCQGTQCGLHLLLRHTSEGVPLSAWPLDALPALGLRQQEGCHQMQRLQHGPRLGAKTNLFSLKLTPL